MSTVLLVTGSTVLDADATGDVTTLAATLYGGNTELDGYSITFSVVDLNTGQTVATFPGTSGNTFSACTIISTYTFGNGPQASPTSLTFVGEANSGNTACDVGSTTLPDGPTEQVYVIEASYAGDSAYAPVSPSALDVVTL